MFASHMQKYLELIPCSAHCCEPKHPQMITFCRIHIIKETAEVNDSPIVRKL